MEQTVKQFRETHEGGYYLVCSEDIPGFAKKGWGIYGNCDDMIVDHYLYQPLNGIYTLFIRNK